MINPVTIQTVNLTKRFDGQVAVDRISLEVKPGEILGFLGPNGAGKTTAIRMICGLLKPDDGEVLFNGIPLKSMPAGKSLLGVCPQENIHWERLTCLEQMVFTGEIYELPRKAARTRSLDLLGQLGLDRQSGKQARKLSGGMKRRLNIALALVHDPPVLILDEPEAGLDPQSRLLMREFIHSLSGTRTIILTTHNMDEADRLSHRVAIIDQGRILKVDTPLNMKHSIGTNNTLQISLDRTPELSTIETIRNRFPAISKLTVDGNCLVVQSPDPIQLMAGLLETVNQLEYQAGEMKLRENTLEDVFIMLTGKNLRS
jgi:ABC-2 type transport system ATP-binding protein